MGHCMKKVENCARARELFKPSKNAYSLIVSILKKFGSFRLTVFVGDIIIGAGFRFFIRPCAVNHRGNFLFPKSKLGKNPHPWSALAFQHLWFESYGLKTTK